MQPEQWEKVKELFTAALDQPVAVRTQFLAEACGPDEALRAEVESLLAAHEEPKNLLEKHTIDLAAQLRAEPQTHFGKRFGAYRILREIGRGGMGAVFLAERADGEFQQQVALKIIRQSFADRGLEEHFRRERQILASLNHPNIARLLDGGVSDTGEPFLAMEFVAGEPLVEFAENHRLTIEERLQLFLRICRAVSSAHQSLIIHRDLKPSNILVTADGTAKLLDFGLAKVLDSDSGLGRTQTETAFRAFTPAYASPEQILGKSVTTASDVFSLGVIFFELLTNEKPFHFEGKTLDEIVKTVTTGEPSLPSRVGDSENAQFAGRQRQLKGDLDNITLKALQKDPRRRYQSVAEFSLDIERHLGNLPISARPNTFQYRAAKFLQRNRIAVAAAAMVLVTLVGGLAISLWQYQKAEREAARSQAVRTFLERMLLTANPEEGSPGKKGYATTISDVLEQAAKRLESEDLANQPDVRAELQEIVGACYLNQGQYELAEKYLRIALASETKLYGENSPKLLKTQLALASLSLTKADYASAERIYARYLPLLRDEYRKGNIEASFLLTALNDYAVLERARGDSKQAEALFRENLAISSHDLSSAQNEEQTESLLALTLLDQGKFNEAEDVARELVRRLKQKPDAETLQVSGTLTLLGSILMEKGSLTEAGNSLREAETIYRKLFSPNAVPIFDNLRLQAQVAYLAGDYAAAETQIDQVLKNYRQNSNPKYISFATALTVQGLILNKLGRRDEAESVLREALRLRTENLPPKHFMTAMTKGALAEVLTSQTKFAEAEPLLRESYEDLELSQGAENLRTLTAKRRLADLYAAWQKPS